MAPTRSASDPARVLSAEKSSYRKSVTDGGVRVVTESIPYVRSVSIGVWANVGSRDETSTDNGISHFLEHMVFKGTRRRSVREIAQSLESLGGYLNAFTTKEHTCFYSRVLDAHLDQAVDVLTDLVQHATFRSEEVAKEKLVVLEELKNAEDDPEDIIHDYFEKTVFPDHSLGFPIIGTEKNLRRFERNDLREHLAGYYVPSNMIVSAAGNVRHDALVRLVNRHFSRRRTRPRIPPRPPLRTGRSKRGLVEHLRPISQAHVCLGTRGYSMHHADRYPLLVMNCLLGEGMSSRLYQSIRERHGLAYSVYSYVQMLSDTGLFGVYVGTDRGKIRDAIDLIHEELDRLRSRPVSHKELARTRSQIKGTMMLGLENMSGRMMRLGTSELYFGVQVPIDEILRKVDAVTPDAIQRVAQDLFHLDDFSTVVIRPS